MAKRKQSGGRLQTPAAKLNYHINTQHVSLRLLDHSVPSDDAGLGKIHHLFDNASDGSRNRRAVLTVLGSAERSILVELSNSRPGGLEPDKFQFSIVYGGKVWLFRGRTPDALSDYSKWAEGTTVRALTVEVGNLVQLWKEAALCTIFLRDMVLKVSDLVVNNCRYVIGGDDASERPSETSTEFVS